MGATAGNLGLFDHNIRMTRTGLTFTAEGTGEVHITAFFTLGVNVGMIATATFFDSETHDIANLAP